VRPVLLVILGGVLTLVLQRVIPAHWPYRVVVILALVLVAALVWLVFAGGAFNSYRELLRDE
jgi:hypothetical protein